MSDKRQSAIVCKAVYLCCLIFFATLNLQTVCAQPFLSPNNLSAPQTDVEAGYDNLYVNGTAIYVVWTAYAGTNNRYSFFRRSIDGGYTWQATQELGLGTARLAFSGDYVYALLRTPAQSSSATVQFRRSVDGGASFDAPQTLAVPTGGVLIGDVQGFAFGSTLFVTWGDGRLQTTGPYFRRSVDNGATFEPARTFAEKGFSINIIAVGDVLYIAQDSLSATYFRRSLDRGATFEPAKIFPITQPNGGPVELAVDRDNVYLLWTANVSGGADLFFVRSTDGGATFDAVVNVTNSPLISAYPKMAVSGKNIFIIYAENQNIATVRSINGGASFQNPVALELNYAFDPDVKFFNSTVYLTWRQRYTSNNITYYETIYRASNDYGANFYPRQTIFGIGYNPQIALLNNVPIILAYGDGISVRRSRPLPTRGFLLNKILPKQF